MPTVTEEKELHIGLEIPRHSARQIFLWAQKQDWPEGTNLEPPGEYHITLLYAPQGRDEHKDAWWLDHMDQAEVEIGGISAFKSTEGRGYAYVLRVDSDEIQEHAEMLQNRAEAWGLPVSKFEEGYKPHITVGYGPSSRLTGVDVPHFHFDVGPSSVSAPRIKESALGSAAPEPPNYRHGTPAKHCANCKMFDKGKCWGFGNKKVKAEAVCDEWAKETKTSAVTENQMWFDPSNKPYGTWGRGFVHGPTQTVHTWPESEASHADMAQAKGFQPQDLIRFDVAPQGEIRFDGYAPSLQQAVQADPRLRLKKVADYNGWSNWETWNTKLMMDNERHHYDAMHGIVEQGGGPEELRQHFEPNLIGSYNRERLQEAQGWNAIDPDERRRMIDERDRAEFGDAAVDLGRNLMGDFNDPGADDTAQVIDPHMVNWDEIHHNILSEYDDDHPLYQQYQNPGPTTFPEGWTKGGRVAYNPEEVQALDHLSLASVAHNLHYKFEEGGLNAELATDYARRLLQMIGYPPDDMTLTAALQTWQQLYPHDRIEDNSPSGNDQLSAPPTVPQESWGYGTTSATKYFYHLAPTAERDRIQAHGLHPGLPMHSERWVSPGEDPEESEVGDQPEGIYVFDSPVDPVNYTGEEMDRWRIPASSIQDMREEQWGQGSQHYITHPVRAELDLPHETTDGAWQAVQPNWRNEPGAYWNSPERNPQWGIGKPDRVIGKASTTHTHYNRWTGLPCNCPWHYQDRKSREASTHLAGQNVNKILKAPDKVYRTPEGEAFRKQLATELGEEHDPLAPYLAQRWKKGEIRLGYKHPVTKEPRLYVQSHGDHRYDLDPGWQDGINMPRGNYWRALGGPTEMTPGPLNRWSPWYNARQHPTRQGVNVMDPNFTVHDMDAKANEHQRALEEERQLAHMASLGQTVHTFPAQPGGGIDWDGAFEALNNGRYDSDYGDAFRHLQENEHYPDPYHSDAMEDADHTFREQHQPTDYDYDEQLAQHQRDQQYAREDLQNIHEKVKANHSIPARKSGWHIKNLTADPWQAREALENEGRMMGHCIGSDSQPYTNLAEKGKIDVYSLRDPKSRPHVTWHYNSDGSLAEIFGPNDDPVKPEYQQMLNEWGYNTGRDTDDSTAVGNHETVGIPEWHAEDPETREDYLDQFGNDGDGLYSLATESGEDIDEDTQVYPGQPKWPEIAKNMMGYGYTYTPGRGTTWGTDPNAAADTDDVQQMYNTARTQRHLPAMHDALNGYEVTHPLQQGVLDQWNQLVQPHFHPYTNQLMPDPVIDQFQDRLPGEDWHQENSGTFSKAWHIEKFAQSPGELTYSLPHTGAFTDQVLEPWESKGITVLHEETPDQLRLHTVEFPPDTRGQGYGGRFMQHIKNYADSEGKAVVVDPVFNQDFFNRFDWLHPESPRRYEYEPMGHSTVPTQVNDPGDHWPEHGQTPPDKKRDIEFSNDWAWHQGSAIRDVTTDGSLPVTNHDS